MHSTTTAARFDIPYALKFEKAPNGLERALISTPAATAEIYLHGAHVTQWKPRGGEPVLFLSSRSLFEPGKAIRGGVPVIFPWFGPRGGGKLGPMHGFARTAQWTVESTALQGDGSVEVVLALEPGDATRGFGYDAFGLQFRVTVGAGLRMALTARNDGGEPLIFEEALHTYFAVGDIHQVSVSGIEGATYIDKTDGFQRKPQGEEPVRVARETDRVYVNTASECVIHDPAWKRRIVVAKSGSNTTVVWNPWIEKTATLTDMAPDDWKGMICVETANAGENAVQLPPGSSQTLTAAIQIEAI